MTLLPKDNETKSVNEKQDPDPVACFKKLLKNPVDLKNLMIFSELIKPKFDQD